MLKKCQEHLQKENITYLSHLKRTIRVFRTLLLCSIIVLLHGIIPSLFQYSTSSRITELMQQEFPKKRRRRIP